MNRAYSILHIKGLDAEQRRVFGLASTPEVDRMGDIVDPAGAKFAASLPLLLHHDTRLPVGSVTLKTAHDGLHFDASIPDIVEHGALKARVDEAWQSIKAGLIKGVSIGFRVLDDGIEQLKSGGLKFKAFEVLELSLVAVPANASASIHTIKSIAQSDLAASGGASGSMHVQSAGVSAPPVVKRRRELKPVAKTITEQMTAYEAKRQASESRMSEIMQQSSDEGVTLDPAQKEEHDTLETEVKEIDEHLVRLRAHEERNRASAVAVAGASVSEASVSRGPAQVRVIDQAPPGIELARMILCSAVAYRSNGQLKALDVAQARYPHSPRIQAYFKGAVPAATTTDAVWAGPLVDPTNLVGEFLEYLRPLTLIGRFGLDGIPSLRSLPFNVRITGQTSGGTGYWVGQGAPKPLTSFAFNAQTLGYTKVAAISVLTEETIRFSSPSAEALVRDGLRDALIERLDTDFIDPAQAAVAGVNPASITNGLVPLSSAGVSSDNARTDIQNLLKAFIQSNMNPEGLVLIMPNTLGLALSLQVNSLGQPEFPGMSVRGGSLLGIPVIATQYAANQSGSGNMVIAVNSRFIGLADDRQVSIDVSREAALQMLDNPTNNSATATATTMVSLWQTNSVGVRAERFINWVVLRDGAVVYMDDVNWGSIGSPA